MQLISKEHCELMEHFERRYRHKLAREPKTLWHIAIYCDGKINEAFKLFREGYALAKAIYQP